MKKLFFLLNVLTILSLNVTAQNVITYEKTNILSLSIQYNITQSRYSANQSAYFDSYTLAMASLQERYDMGYYYVKSELAKVINLRLVNKENNSYLESFKKARMSYWRSISNADLTKQDVVQSCINNIVDIYTLNPSLVDELKLLQGCNIELNRIKYKDPDNYIYSKRYRAISSVLFELENCTRDKIKSLSWEQTELLMK